MSKNWVSQKEWLSMRKKIKVMIIMATIAIFVLGGSIVFLCFRNSEKRIERIIGFPLVDGMAVEKMISYKEGGDEFGAIKLSTDLSEKELIKIISSRFGENRLDASEYRPNHDGNALWDELNKTEYTISSYFFRFEEGKRAKTREVEVYVATDQTGKNYLFVFY